MAVVVSSPTVNRALELPQTTPLDDDDLGDDHMHMKISWQKRKAAIRLVAFRLSDWGNMKDDLETASQTISRRRMKLTLA